MTTIAFEERAVAFVDVLGFKSIVAQAIADPLSLKRLEALVDLLGGAVPTFDGKVSPSVPKQLIPRHNYISDSIILSAPIADPATPGYSGLEAIVMRVIQLTHHFLNEGYLVRGGIAVGMVWHTADNIVGPAYQEAYAIEASGNEPCVLLSEGAAQIWRKGRSLESRMCISMPRRRIIPCSNTADRVMVNGLHDYYIPNNTEHGAIEDRYRKYAELVAEQLSSANSRKANEKWKWFGSYLRAESEEGKKWVAA